MKANMRVVPKVKKLSKPYEEPPKPEGLMNPAFEWKPAVATDVQATWRRFGGVPPTELKAKHEGRT